MNVSYRSWLLLILLLVGIVEVQAQPPRPQRQSQPQPQSQLQPQSSTRKTAYVSDLVDLPLRAGASDRHKIVGAVRTGSAVEVLQVDTKKGYSQIRLSSKLRGWIRNDQLSDTPSSREQLTKTRQDFDQLQTRHSDLEQHIDQTVNKPGGETLSYAQLYDEAARLRQQLAQYRKVASDTVAIDERNQNLQERTVNLERELRMAQQENRALRNDNDNMRYLIGAILLGACLLVAVLVPKIREQRRAQWSQL